MSQIGYVGAIAVAAEKIGQEEAVVHGGADFGVAAALAIGIAACHEELATTYGETGRRGRTHCGQRQVGQQDKVNQRQEQGFEEGLCLLTGKTADQVRPGTDQEGGHGGQGFRGESNIRVQKAEDVGAGQCGERMACVLLAVPATG